MADEVKQDKGAFNSTGDVSQPAKDSSPAQPQQVAPGQEGVQVGGLDYTENEDGTRDYPSQEPVKTQDDPTPQPEQVDAPAPQPTSQPAGQ